MGLRLRQRQKHLARARSELGLAAFGRGQPSTLIRGYSLLTCWGIVGPLQRRVSCVTWRGERQSHSTHYGWSPCLRRRCRKMPSARTSIMPCWSRFTARLTTIQSPAYSPATSIGCRTGVRSGDPDPKHISISFVERQNLSVRQRFEVTVPQLLSRV